MSVSELRVHHLLTSKMDHPDFVEGNHISRLDACLREYMRSFCCTVDDSEIRRLIQRFNSGKKSVEDIVYNGHNKISEIKNIRVDNNGKIKYSQSMRKISGNASSNRGNARLTIRTMRRE